MMRLPRSLLDAAPSAELRTALFTVWAGYRPLEAAAALTRIPEIAPGRAELVGAVLRAVATEHPAAFLREAAAMEAAFPDEFDFRAPEAAARLAFEDPALAVGLAERSSGFARALGLSAPRSAAKDTEKSY